LVPLAAASEAALRALSSSALAATDHEAIRPSATRPWVPIFSPLRCVISFMVFFFPAVTVVICSGFTPEALIEKKVRSRRSAILFARC